MPYDPHRKYVKVGNCRRCGRCCDLHCPQFKWVALKDIRAGETFKSGIDVGFIKAVCEIFDKPITEGSCTLEVRKGFPFNPGQVPPQCGFRFEAEQP